MAAKELSVFVPETDTQIISHVFCIAQMYTISAHKHSYSELLNPRTRTRPAGEFGERDSWRWRVRGGGLGRTRTPVFPPSSLNSGHAGVRFAGEFELVRGSVCGRAKGMVKTSGTPHGLKSCVKRDAWRDA